MKIGNLEIRWHKHQWQKQILAEFRNEFGQYTLKIGEVCVKPNCKAGYYRSVYSIECSNKPEAYKID